MGEARCGTADLPRRRICHITTVHPWSDARIFNRMCAVLAQRGHEVTLVAPVEAERVEQGVRLLPVGPPGKIRRQIHMPGLLRRLSRLDAEIYHFHDPELLPWMSVFHATSSSRRVVYDVHEYYPESAYTSNYFGWRPLSRMAGAVYAVAEPLLAQSLSAVVAVTPPIAERFTGGDARVAVVRNAARGNMPQLDLPDDMPSPRTIVLAGVMNEGRLMTQLLDALVILLPRWPDLHLLAIGDLLRDPYGQTLRTRASVFGIEDHITFRDRLPWDDLQRYLAASVVGLVLLEESENHRRALPNRMFEFMAVGVPIVSTDFTLLTDIIRSSRCGILLSDDTPQAIAEGIEAILRDTDAAREMGARGREAVQREHSLEVEISKLEALYDAICRG